MPGDEYTQAGLPILNQKPKTDTGLPIFEKKSSGESVSSSNALSTPQDEQSKPLEKPTTPTTNLSPSSLLFSNSADKGEFLGGAAIPEKQVPEDLKLQHHVLTLKAAQEHPIFQPDQSAIASQQFVKDNPAIVGTAFLQKGDTDNANTQFDVAIQNNPTDVKALIGKGYIASNNDDTDTAIKYYQDAANQNDGSATMLLAGAQLKKATKAPLEGKIDLKGSVDLLHESLKNIDAVIASNPDDLEAHVIKAKVLESLGMKDEATAERKLSSNLFLKQDHGVDANDNAQLAASIGNGISKMAGTAIAHFLNPPEFLNQVAQGVVEGNKDMSEGVAQMNEATKNGNFKDYTAGTLKQLKGAMNMGFSAMMGVFPESGYTIMQSMNAADELTNGEASKIVFAPLQSVLKPTSDIGQSMAAFGDAGIGLIEFGIAHKIISGNLADAKKTESALTKLKNKESLTVEETQRLHDEIKTNLNPVTVQRILDAVDKLPNDVSKTVAQKAIPLIAEKKTLEEQKQALETEKGKIDESFHPSKDEEIAALDKKITEIKQDIAETIKSEGLKVREKVGLPLGEPAIEQPFQKPESGIFSNVPEPTTEPTRVSKLKESEKQSSGVTVEKPTTTLTPEELTNPPKTEKNSVTETDSHVLPISEIDKLRSQRQTDLATGNAIELEKTLIKDGVKEPLVITYYPKEGKAVLTDGHSRLDAAKDAGAENMPVRIVEKYSDAPPNAKDFTPPTPKETPPIELTNEGGETKSELPISETPKQEKLTPTNESQISSEAPKVSSQKEKHPTQKGVKTDIPYDEFSVHNEKVMKGSKETEVEFTERFKKDDGGVSGVEPLNQFKLNQGNDKYGEPYPKVHIILDSADAIKYQDSFIGSDGKKKYRNADFRNVFNEIAKRRRDKESEVVLDFRKSEVDNKKLYDNPKPETSPEVSEAPKAEKTFTEKGKKLADKIRKLKSKPLELKDENGNPLTIEQQGFDLNPIIDAIADGVEKGGEIADVIKAELEKAKWFQNLTDKGKEAVSKQLEDHFGGDVSGISHAMTEETRQEFGLGDPYEGRNKKTDVELNTEAENKIKEGYNIEGLISDMERGKHPNDVETVIVKKYKAGLEATIEKDPSDANLNELRRLVKATDKIGSEQGAAFRQRQGLDLRDDSLAGFFTRDQDVNEGAPLTETQKAKVINEFNNIKEAQKKYDAKIAKLEADLAKAKAEQKVRAEKQVAKKVKRTHEDFVEERKKIAESIREKLRKSRGQANEIINATVEFAKIAPDVAKLVKSYVEEGVSKLEDIVKAIHPILKENLPDITEKDVHDIIAGEHNQPKKTRNEISQKVFELKQQAKLVNQLEALKRGEQPKTERAKIKHNIEVEKLQQQIKDFRKEKAADEAETKKLEGQLQKEADKSTPEQARLKTLKNKLANEILQLEDDLRKGNYEKPTSKPKIKLDKEAIQLQDELIKLKQEREVRLLKDEYANRTTQQKFKDRSLEILNIPRTLMSSMDFSAPLRQGIIATIAHPGIAAKAGLEMFRQSVSQKRFDRWFHDLRNDPRFKLMEDAGLYVSDPHDPRLSAKEEAFMNNLAEKIPVIGTLVKGSERAYVGYLNKMRVDIFNRGAELLETSGKTFENSPKEYKALADWVNNSTGRGKLGKAEVAAPILNSLIFAPRLIASRLNLLNPLYYKKLPAEIRQMALKDMAKFVGFGLTVLAVSKLAGADVEPDPRSTDFGKIKVGNTRWDIWGGFQPYIRIVAQMFAGESKSTRTGQIQELSGQGAFGRTRGDVLASFARGKLSPVPAMAWDFLSGKTVTGDKVTVTKEIASHLVPMIANDVIAAAKDQGVSAIFTTGIPSTFGVGVQTYAPRGYDREMVKDPTYKYLYDKQMNITTPNQGEMNDKEYDNFLSKREKMFKTEWKNVIDHGAFINEDGNATIDPNNAVKKVPSAKLTLDELSDLMKSIGSKATRDAKKKPKTGGSEEGESPTESTESQSENMTESPK